MSSIPSLERQVWVALMAATVALGAFLHFPLGPVPFSMQPFFIMLAGLVLGPAGGAASMLLYLAAGCLGLPVFAGGASGFARLLGPTGGYLIGFVAQAAIAGLATRGRGEELSWIRGISILLLSMVPAYVFGVIVLKLVMDIGWAKAGAVGALPFLPGDVIKTALAVAVYKMLRRRGALPAPPQPKR